MRTCRLVLSLSCILLLTCSQPASRKYKVEIFDCQSGALCTIDDGKLHCFDPFFNSQEEYNFTVELSKHDIEKISININEFLSFHKVPKILDNKCIVDGSNYKLKFYSDGEMINRILLANFYDQNLSAVFEILDRYLQQKDAEFGMVLDSFIDLKHEETCLEEMTKEVIEEKLNGWCKIPSIK